MDDLRHEIDLSAWRVEPLSSTFADDVVARLVARDDALDGELEAMADELLLERDEVELRPPRPRARRRGIGPLQVASVALVAAAALLVWLRPAPRSARVGIEVPPVSVSTNVDPEPPLAVADLDRAGIRRAVHEQFVPKAKRCYDALLRRAPSSEGRVAIEFGVIAKDGRGVVDDAKVLPDAEITDEAFHECLVDAMLQVVFDAPGKERLVIVYPIVFRRPDAGASAEVSIEG